MTTDGAPRARERAPAKINLYLHVLGRRPDGFHDLDSLVAFAEVHDVVELTIADTFSLAIDGPFASALAATPHTDNLAFRAARASAADSGTAFRIRLTKNLPVAAGLGGGAADAAAVLRAAARLLDIPPLSLLPVARTLGADVPVCLHGRPMVMTGIGEILTPAPPLPAAPIVLACPPVAAPTFPTARDVAQARGRHQVLPPTFSTVLQGCQGSREPRCAGKTRVWEVHPAVRQDKPAGDLSASPPPNTDHPTPLS